MRTIKREHILRVIEIKRSSMLAIVQLTDGSIRWMQRDTIPSHLREEYYVERALEEGEGQI